MNKYLALDTETGGTTLDTSLLTVYLGVFDENLNRVDEVYFRVKPDDGIYRVTAQAMAINKIDLKQHDTVATTYSDTKTPFYNFLKKNYQGEKFIPVGHGLNFDLTRVKHDLISAGSWENFVSYRGLDTSIAARFLIAAGKIPNSISGSLESLSAHFGLPKIGELHDAQIDTLMTVEVLKKLIQTQK